MCHSQNKEAGGNYEVIGGLQRERAIRLLKDFYEAGNPAGEFLSSVHG